MAPFHYATKAVATVNVDPVRLRSSLALPASFNSPFAMGSLRTSGELDHDTALTFQFALCDGEPSATPTGTRAGPHIVSIRPMR